MSSLRSGSKTRAAAISAPWPALLVFITYVVVTIVLTLPLLFHLTTAVPSDIGDPLLNTWILAWDSHALLTDPLNLFNANIFYPVPNTLAYSEHLLSTALLALPIQLISAEPVTAYNISLLASFPMAAFGMYLLTLHLTGRRSAAFVAGLIFAFAPYRFAAIAHLQLLTFQWLPFALLCFELALKRVGVRDEDSVPMRKSPNPWPLALTIFLLLQLLASWYLALYTLLILGIYLLTAFLTRPLTRHNLIQIGLSFLVTMFLVLPVAWPYLALLDNLRAARPLALALSLAATPADFAAAAPFNFFFGPLTESLRNRPNFTEENTLFVGCVAPALALIALTVGWAWPGWRRSNELRPTDQSEASCKNAAHLKVTFPLGILFALLATLLLSLIFTFSGPYTSLAHFFPASTIIRVPARWIIPALFAQAGLAGVGYAIITIYISRITQHMPPTLSYLKPTVFLLICALLLGETLSIPLPLAPVENRTTLNPAYHWLAAYPGPSAVVELPLHSAPAPEFPEVKRLYASTLGWWHLVNGYSGFTPPRQPQLAKALAPFPAPRSIAALQNLASPSASSPPLFLLVHPGEAPFDRGHWESTARWQAERNPALLPLGQFEGDYLYLVNPPTPTRFATPIAAFGPNHTVRLLAYSLSTSTNQLSNPPLRLPPHVSQLILYWQLTTSLPADMTVFIHLRASDGFVRSQADGPPVSGHYPTSAWRTDEIIQDIHSLPSDDLTRVDHLAIGLYDANSGKRLPAFTASGEPLADDALIIPLLP